jgi:hypothetical protein
VTRAELKIGTVIEHRRRGRPRDRAVITQVYRKDKLAAVLYADGQRRILSWIDLRYWQPVAGDTTQLGYGVDPELGGEAA